MVMLFYIYHVMENDKVMRETVKEQWLIHYFLYFKRVYLKSTCFAYSSLREKERTGNTARVNIEFIVVKISKIHWFLENQLFTTMSENKSERMKINDGRESFTTVVDVLRRSRR